MDRTSEDLSTHREHGHSEADGADAIDAELDLEAKDFVSEWFDDSVSETQAEGKNEDISGDQGSMIENDSSQHGLDRKHCPDNAHKDHNCAEPSSRVSSGSPLTMEGLVRAEEKEAEEIPETKPSMPANPEVALSDSASEPMLTLTIKLLRSHNFTVQIPDAATVGDLRALLASHSELQAPGSRPEGVSGGGGTIDSSRLRLIYGGRVLRDEESVKVSWFTTVDTILLLQLLQLCSSSA
jgi:hypothetical protein